MAPAICFAIVAILAVVLGRIETFDLTEGQALVNGWVYWLIAFIASIFSALSIKNDR